MLKFSPEEILSGPNEDTAWAAGLFEGEGCIYVRGRSTKLSLVMADEDVVRRFARVVGCGSVRRQKPANERCKPVWRWYIGAWPAVVTIMRKLEPYLGERRRTKWEEAKASRSLCDEQKAFV